MISCSAGCKRQVEDPAQAGWWFLEISSRWRCGACDRELRAASEITGMHGDSGDALSKDSRGALSKETASTILPTSKELR